MLDSPKPRSSSSKRCICIILTTLLFSSINCKADDNASQAVEAIPVEVLELERVPFRDTFETTAVAYGTDDVLVSAESAGRVERLSLKEGEPVERGETILESESTIDQTQLDLAKNRKELAQKEFERTKQLVENGVSTEQQLDRARSNLQEARLSYKQMKQRLDNSVLTSPRTGFVLTKRVEQGEYVAPGAPIARIAKLDPIEFHAQIGESRLNHVESGDSVEIAVPQISETLEAQVTDVALAADGPTRTYRVEIEVDNPEKRIRPGTHGKVYFTKSDKEKRLLIPREAVLIGVNRKEVMVAKTDKSGKSVAARKIIETGPGAGPKLTVEKGLDASQRLIVRGHRGISSGTVVEVTSTYASLEEFLANVAE